MKSVFASIDITSQILSLEELSRLIGIKVPAGSHQKGPANWGHRPWNESLLRIESQIPNDAELDRHLEFLLDLFDNRMIAGKLAGSGGVEATLNLGIAFRTANLSITLSSAILARIALSGMAIGVSAYPSTD